MASAHLNIKKIVLITLIFSFAESPFDVHAMFAARQGAGANASQDSSQNSDDEFSDHEDAGVPDLDKECTMSSISKRPKFVSVPEIASNGTEKLLNALRTLREIEPRGMLESEVQELEDLVNAETSFVNCLPVNWQNYLVDQILRSIDGVSTIIQLIQSLVTLTANGAPLPALPVTSQVVDQEDLVLPNEEDVVLYY